MATAIAFDPSPHNPDLARVSEIDAGLPASALRALIDDDVVTLSDLAGVVGSRRTLDRRLAGNSRLSPEESDRFARFGEVLALAAHIFGDRKRAMEWLRTPKSRLGGAEPLRLMRTHTGTELVVNLLNLGRHGMLA